MSDMPAAVGSEARVAQLSPREMQVAILSAEGATIAELARDLGIGTGTVMSIRRHIRNKLGLTRDESLDESLLEAISRLGMTAPPAGGPGAAPSAQATLARRRYLVLRQAISELERTCERISQRANTMSQFNSEVDDPGQTWQLHQLRSLSEGLGRFTDEFITSVRDSAPE